MNRPDGSMMARDVQTRLVVARRLALVTGLWVVSIAGVVSGCPCEEPRKLGEDPSYIAKPTTAFLDALVERDLAKALNHCVPAKRDEIKAQIESYVARGEKFIETRPGIRMIDKMNCMGNFRDAMSNRPIISAHAIDLTKPLPPPYLPGRRVIEVLVITPSIYRLAQLNVAYIPKAEEREARMHTHAVLPIQCEEIDGEWRVASFPIEVFFDVQRNAHYTAHALMQLLVVGEVGPPMLELFDPKASDTKERETVTRIFREWNMLNAKCVELEMAKIDQSTEAGQANFAQAKRFAEALAKSSDRVFVTDYTMISSSQAPVQPGMLPTWVVEFEVKAPTYALSLFEHSQQKVQFMPNQGSKWKVLLQQFGDGKWRVAAVPFLQLLMIRVN